MKINRNNYEAFFVDYLDGKLDEKLVNDFIEFLQKNPDLKEELSLFDTVAVEAEDITFNKKELLLKEKYDVEQAFNEAAIAQLEGEILASENAEFENYLSTHPERQKEAKLFGLTKLQPDVTVVFSKKNKIYKRSAVRTVLLWTMRAAAVIVVALSVYTFVGTSDKKIITETQVATIENASDKNIYSQQEITAKPEIWATVEEVPEKSTIKKLKSKSERTNVLREKSPDLPENGELALVRPSEEAPAKLKSLNPSLDVKIANPDLVLVETTIFAENEPMEDERLFVDVIKEKTGIGKLTFGKITKAGLSLVASLSNEKFNYETNAEGKITEVKYDSRILAFSVPTKNEIDRK
jgi:hypothetical protein